MLRTLTEKEIDEAIIELRKRTDLINSFSYYLKPSEKRNRRNHRRRKKMKKQLMEQNQKRKY